MTIKAEELLEKFFHITWVIGTNNPDFDNAIKMRNINVARSALLHCKLIGDNELINEIEDFISKLELPRNVKVIFGNQCESCKFNNECRFKNENINNNCKFFIKI